MKARLILLVAWVFALVMIVVSVQQKPAQAAPVWEGVYRVTGENQDGSTYAGAVQVVRWHQEGSDLYYATWMLDGHDQLTERAFGLAYGEHLALTSVDHSLPMLFTASGDGRWAFPDPTLKNALREQWTRTAFKTLPEAVRPQATTPRLQAQR